MISSQNKQIKRGEVYWIKLDPTLGSEINKTRPALVISNDIQNKVSSRIVIIPIASNIVKVFPFEALIMLKDKKAKVLADQIRSIDKLRIGDYLGRITKLELSKIELALKITLSLA